MRSRRPRRSPLQWVLSSKPSRRLGLCIQLASSSTCGNDTEMSTWRRGGSSPPLTTSLTSHTIRTLDPVLVADLKSNTDDATFAATFRFRLRCNTNPKVKGFGKTREHDDTEILSKSNRKTPSQIAFGSLAGSGCRRSPSVKASFRPVGTPGRQALVRMTTRLWPPRIPTRRCGERSCSRGGHQQHRCRSS